MPNFAPITEDQLDKIGPQIIPGTEKRKSPYTEGQTKDAGFAFRMEQALKKIEDIESSGFNPANFRDIMIDYLGGTGFDEKGQPVEGGVRQWAERMMLSSKFKQYERAKIDFASAQLRKETGAVINPSEMVWVDKTYFPKFMDDVATLQDYHGARRAATGAMRVGAGKAYDDVREAVDDFNEAFGTDTPVAAMTELRRRAQEDPKLAEKLRAMGLL
jgi:hypothetical protein